MITKWRQLEQFTVSFIRNHRICDILFPCPFLCCFHFMIVFRILLFIFSYHLYMIVTLICRVFTAVIYCNFYELYDNSEFLLDHLFLYHFMTLATTLSFLKCFSLICRAFCYLLLVFIFAQYAYHFINTIFLERLVSSCFKSKKKK